MKDALATGRFVACHTGMRFWLQLAWIPLLALLGAGVSAVTQERPTPPPLATDAWARTPEQLAEMGGFLWVDARSAEVFAAGHIDGAVNVSLNDWDAGFERLIGAWSGGPVVVYCDGAGCELSREVAERLRAELGLEAVYWLQGGYEAWNDFAR